MAISRFFELPYIRPTFARTTLRGIGLSYCSAVVLGILQVITTALVARQVTPQVFGLVAMAQLVLRLTGYFSQFGVGSALIQKQQIDDDDMSAAHYLAIGSGLLFTGLTWTLAPLSRTLFHSDDVVWVIRILSLSFLLSSLGVTPLSLLRRDLRFGAVSAVEVVSYTVGYAIPCLILVFRGYGLWGLIAGNLASYAVQVVILLKLEPPRWKLARQWATYRGLLSYGSQVSAIGFLEYINFSIDVFSIGRWLGPAALGLYTRAANIANVPLNMATAAVARVLFPAFSRVQHDILKLRRTYVESLTLTLLLTCPLGFIMVPAAPSIVRFLLGPQWSAASAPLMVFGSMAPFTMAVALPGIVLDATGTLSKKLQVRAVTLTATAVLMYIHRYDGIMVVAWIMFGCSLATFVGYHALVACQLRLTWRAAVKPLLLGCLAGGLPCTLIAVAAQRVSAGVLPMLALEGSLLLLAYLQIFFFCPFQSVNIMFYRVLAELSGRIAPLPSVCQSQCVARQILFVLRAEQARETVKCA